MTTMVPVQPMGPPVPPNTMEAPRFISANYLPKGVVTSGFACKDMSEKDLRDEGLVSTKVKHLTQEKTRVLQLARDKVKRMIFEFAVLAGMKKSRASGETIAHWKDIGCHFCEDPTVETAMPVYHALFGGFDLNKNWHIKMEKVIMDQFNWTYITTSAPDQLNTGWKDKSTVNCIAQIISDTKGNLCKGFKELFASKCSFYVVKSQDNPNAKQQNGRKKQMKRRQAGIFYDDYLVQVVKNTAGEGVPTKTFRRVGNGLPYSTSIVPQPIPQFSGLLPFAFPPPAAPQASVDFSSHQSTLQSNFPFETTSSFTTTASITNGLIPQDAPPNKENINADSSSLPAADSTQQSQSLDSPFDDSDIGSNDDIFANLGGPGKGTTRQEPSSTLSPSPNTNLDSSPSAADGGEALTTTVQDDKIVDTVSEQDSMERNIEALTMAKAASQNKYDIEKTILAHKKKALADAQKKKESAEKKRVSATCTWIWMQLMPH